MKSITVTVNGTDREIPTLTIGDLIELEEVAYRGERQRLIDSLDDFRLDPTDRRLALEGLEDRRGSELTARRFLFSMEGTRAVLARTAGRAGVEPDSLALDPVALVRLVAQLAHFDLSGEGEASDNGTGDDEEAEITGARPTEAAPTGGSASR